MVLVLTLLLGAVVGGGIFLLVLAVVGVPQRDPSKPPLFRRRTSAREGTLRLARGVGVGVLTLVLSHWVVAGVGIGAARRVLGPGGR